MSTKCTIADVTIEGMFIHVYTECFDPAPQDVYVEMWEQGEQDNASMTVSMPQADALTLADDLAAWAKRVRAHEEAGE